MLFTPPRSISGHITKIEFNPQKVENFHLIPFPRETHSRLKKSRVAFLINIVKHGRRKEYSLVPDHRYDHIYLAHGGDRYYFVIDQLTWSTEKSFVKPLILKSFEPAYALI